MLKETPKSLRLFFGAIAFLSAVIAAGAASQIALVLRKNPEAQISALFVAQAVFRLMGAVAFGFVVVKFRSLIRGKPRVIKAIIHANFGGLAVFALIFRLYGTQLNYLGLLISVLVYVYLLRSVDRISKETVTVQTIESGR